MRVEQGFLSGFLVLGFVIFVAGFLAGMLSIGLIPVSPDYTMLGFMLFMVGLASGIILVAIVWLVKLRKNLQKSA